jgi:hypothetical protein
LLYAVLHVSLDFKYLDFENANAVKKIGEEVWFRFGMSNVIFCPNISDSVVLDVCDFDSWMGKSAFCRISALWVVDTGPPAHVTHSLLTAFYKL